MDENENVSISTYLMCVNRLIWHMARLETLCVTFMLRLMNYNYFELAFYIR